jgi:hypothetical protein
MRPERIAIRRTPKLTLTERRDHAQNKYEEAEGKCKQSVEICRSTIQDRKKVRSCACVHAQDLGTGFQLLFTLAALGDSTLGSLRCLRQAGTEEALKEATELEEVLQDLLAKLEELAELAAHERSAKVGMGLPWLKHD